ncbi:MAG: ATP-binding cassette domain-containing protein [Fimbriimonas sp.]
MSEVLGLEHLALGADGPTLTLSVRTGQAIAILGPSGAGKSRLLRILAGEERPGQGKVHLRGRVAVASDAGLSRRTRVHALGRGGEVQDTTNVLLATGLFDVRNLTYGELSPSRAAACELVGPLLADADLVLLDGQLDRVDPWALASIEERMRSQRAAGRSFVFTTHRPDLAARADGVVVLRGGQVRFAGSVEELVRSGPPHTLHVETEDQAGVRALVEPFEVSIRPEGNGLRLEAREGQALAARLLLEGYGDVRFVVMRPPTVEEALRRL